MSIKLTIPNKQELTAFYNEHRSISKTSKQYKTSNPTVRTWLKHYDIPRYTQKEASIFDTQSKKIESPSKEELENIYQTTSLVKMARLYEVTQNTIVKWIEEYSIPRISQSDKLVTVKANKFNRRFPFTKKSIEKDYAKVQCMGSLASLYGCSMTTIKKLFKLYEIEAKFAKSSVGQNEISNYIQSLGFDILKNDRKLIVPLELDIVIPDKKLAIEYCGIYFHSETWGNKDRLYHLKKQKLCENKGYNLITIFESEWHGKKDIIKSILAHKLGHTSKKIYARNTTFKKIDYSVISIFEKNNHLQGSCPANDYYGLFHDNELVMSASFGIPRFNKSQHKELIRMTARKYTSVVGGVTKLLKNADIKKCLTYADKRFGTGQSYLDAGFTKIKDSSPNYFYFHKSDHDKLYSRNKFQKKRIPNVDLSKTEYENMLEKGYDRIWDCGNSVFIKG